jgi:hypothetical protein
MQAGFKSRENTSVHVTEAISGGFVLRVQDQNGNTGDLTIVGPGTVITDPNSIANIVDSIWEFAKKIWDGIKTDGGGVGGSGGNKGCVVVSGNNNTVTILGNLCPAQR